MKLRKMDCILQIIILNSFFVVAIQTNYKITVEHNAGTGNITENYRMQSRNSTEYCYHLCSCTRRRVRCEGNDRNLDFIPRVSKDITILDFSENYLPFVSQQTLKNVSLSKLVILNLSKNKIKNITKDAFSKFQKIDILYLSDNPSLKNVTVSEALYSFQNKTGPDLHLRKMGWDFLADDMFRGISNTNVTFIDLSNNFFKNINGNIFRNLSSLIGLDVSTNRISDFQSRGLRNLQTLDLSRNVLLYVPNFCDENFSSFVPNLEELQLNDNKIMALDKNSFRCLENLFQLEINDNPLFYMGANSIASMTLLSSIQMKNIGVEEVFLTIDRYALNSSSLRYFKLSFTTEYPVIEDEQNFFSHLPNLQNLELERNGFGYNDTSHIFDMLIPLKKIITLSIKFASIYKIPEFVLSNFKFLNVLDLSGNFISSLGEHVFDNVTSLLELHLNGNQLSVFHQASFPENVLSTLEVLDFSNNPISCTCENLWFRNWVKTTKVYLVSYPAFYTCEFPAKMKNNKTLFNDYNPTSEDCKDLNILVIVLPLATAVVFVMVTLLLVYRFRWHIRYRIFLIRRKNYIVFNDEDYQYDGYLIYSDDDREFVHERLIPNMEEGEELSLCIRLRDFEPGRLILDNVVENMNRSRKIIAIISNNFVNDEWTQYELTLAQTRLVEEGQGVLLLIKLEDIENRNMTESLFALFSTLKSLTWTQNENAINLFWQQMASFLRHGPEAINNACNV